MTNLHKRAVEEMRRWRKSLSRTMRATLNGGTLSVWARKGGNIIVAKAPPTRRQAKQRSEREQLKLNPEAHLRAERAAYEDAKLHGEACGDEGGK